MNTDNVITQDNIGKIFETMRASVAEEVQLEADKKIKEERRIARRKEKLLREKQKILENRLVNEIKLNKDTADGIDSIILSFAKSAKRFEEKLRNGERKLLLLMTTLTVIATIFISANYLATWISIVITAVTALVGAYFNLREIYGGSLFNQKIIRLRDQSFKNKLLNAGQSHLLEKYVVDWDTCTVRRTDSNS